MERQGRLRHNILMVICLAWFVLFSQPIFASAQRKQTHTKDARGGEKTHGKQGKRRRRRRRNRQRQRNQNPLSVASNGTNTQQRGRVSLGSQPTTRGRDKGDKVWQPRPQNTVKGGVDRAGDGAGGVGGGVGTVTSRSPSPSPAAVTTASTSTTSPAAVTAAPTAQQKTEVEDSVGGAGMGGASAMAGVGDDARGVEDGAKASTTNGQSVIEQMLGLDLSPSPSAVTAASTSTTPRSGGGGINVGSSAMAEAGDGAGGVEDDAGRASMGGTSAAGAGRQMLAFDLSSSPSTSPAPTAMAAQPSPLQPAAGPAAPTSTPPAQQKTGVGDDVERAADDAGRAGGDVGGVGSGVERAEDGARGLRGIFNLLKARRGLLQKEVAQQEALNADVLNALAFTTCIAIWDPSSSDYIFYPIFRSVVSSRWEKSSIAWNSPIPFTKIEEYCNKEFITTLQSLVSDKSSYPCLFLGKNEILVEGDIMIAPTPYTDPITGDRCFNQLVQLHLWEQADERVIWYKGRLTGGFSEIVLDRAIGRAEVGRFLGEDIVGLLDGFQAFKRFLRREGEIFYSRRLYQVKEGQEFITWSAKAKTANDFPYVIALRGKETSTDLHYYPFYTEDQESPAVYQIDWGSPLTQTQFNQLFTWSAPKVSLPEGHGFLLFSRSSSEAVSKGDIYIEENSNTGGVCQVFYLPALNEKDGENIEWYKGLWVSDSKQVGLQAIPKDRIEATVEFSGDENTIRLSNKPVEFYQKLEAQLSPKRSDKDEDDEKKSEEDRDPTPGGGGQQSEEDTNAADPWPGVIAIKEFKQGVGMVYNYYPVYYNSDKEPHPFLKIALNSPIPADQVLEQDKNQVSAGNKESQESLTFFYFDHIKNKTYKGDIIIGKHSDSERLFEIKLPENPNDPPQYYASLEHDGMIIIDFTQLINDVAAINDDVAALPADNGDKLKEWIKTGKRWSEEQERALKEEKDSKKRHRLGIASGIVGVICIALRAYSDWRKISEQGRALYSEFWVLLDALGKRVDPKEYHFKGKDSVQTTPSKLNKNELLASPIYEEPSSRVFYSYLLLLIIFILGLMIGTPSFTRKVTTY